MSGKAELRPIGDDWFLWDSLDDPEAPDYAAVLAGEAGVKLEASKTSRAVTPQARLRAAVRLHLTHVPLLGGREAVLSHPADLAAPRLYLQEKNPAWWNELRSYQQETALWAASRVGSIIAHDLGLGKTRTGLAAGRPPMLILCPKSAASVWEDECAYAGLRCAVLEGRPPSFDEVKALFEERRKETDVWLLNYHVAEYWVRYFCRLGPIQGIHTIICDEAHYLQKPSLLWTQTINGIARERCILMTATPMRNRLRSLWSLLNTACPGAFGKQYDFRKQYLNAQDGSYGLEDGGEEWRRSQKGQEMLRRLQLRLGEVLCKLTREQAQHAVVPLTRQVRYVELAPDVLSKVLDESAEAAARLKGGGATLAWYTDMRHRFGLLKVPEAAGLAMEMLPKWKRIVLWVWHDDVVSALKSELAQRLCGVHIDEILGKTSQKKRDAVARAWKAVGSVAVDDLEQRVLIASIAAASQALSFTTAGLSIFIESDWAPLHMQQAEKRTHRFGQVHPRCEAIYCVLKGTIDETIAEVLLEKAAESEEVLGEDGQVEQMSTLLGTSLEDTEDSNEAFMQRVAAKLLASREEEAW